MNIQTQEKSTIDRLWKRYTRSRDMLIRDELIVNHLYLVKYVVGRMVTHLPGHVKLDDLFSSGVTGLIRSVEKFDPSKKSKFESYAILLIKGAIIDELRKLDWIPRSVHQKANAIATAQHDLGQKLGREPSDAEVSTYLGLSAEEYSQLLDRIRPIILLPLNAEDPDEEQGALSEKIADDKAFTGLEVAQKRECHALLEAAIKSLPEQEQRVLQLYYFEELTLKEIGEVLGVSESRISQIHTKALLKLRSALKPTLKNLY